jgi:hypothetical protein
MVTASCPRKRGKKNKVKKVKIRLDKSASPEMSKIGCDLEVIEQELGLHVKLTWRIFGSGTAGSPHAVDGVR